MRILNLDSTRMARGFTELGHEVFRVGYQEDADLQAHSPRNAVDIYNDVCGRGFVPDYVFWCDDGNLPYFPGVEELPCPTAYYSIDTYCNLWHFGFANAFDVVFVAQKEHVPLFSRDPVPVYWLPLFAMHVPPATAWVERDIPVSFVGNRQNANNPDREGFLQRFRRRQPVLLHTGAYEEIFSRSMIGLNQTACSEINYRCFEIMACGAALLMEHSLHGLDELFTPGENILPLYVRNDWEQAAAIAAEALREPERLAAIAAAGRDHVVRNHLVSHRAAFVHAIMADLIRENGASRRLEQLAHRRKLLVATYSMLGLDLASSKLDARYANYYLGLAKALEEPGNAPAEKR